MSDNVHILNNVTRLPIPVTRVIDNIPENMQEIVIIGIDADGNEYFASSEADGPKVLWNLERAKMKLLSVVDNFTD